MEAATATVSAKFTEISGIKLRENPRQIILPDDFDGRIQIDVSFCNFSLVHYVRVATITFQIIKPPLNSNFYIP